MRTITRIIIPAAAVISYFFTLLIYYFYIWTGRHYKMLQSANLKLRQNINNASVNEYMHILNKLKFLPNTRRNTSLLSEAYTLIRSSKTVDDDLKTQFRVTVLLKGVNKIQ